MTTITDTIQNPWINLPDTAPYIAPIDKLYVNDSISHLHLEIQPTPYLGNLKSADVVVLALNPGFVPEDLIWYPSPIFTELHRCNLEGNSQPAFFALDERLSGSGAYIWWRRILKGLNNAGVSYDILAQKIMCIQYFPYHSVTYTGLSQTLPSQEYSFHLLREAIKQRKKIVVMRSEKLWLEDVPELASTEYIKLKNPRNPTLSPANMTIEQFQSLINTLTGTL
jgi:hypothetical protein